MFFHGYTHPKENPELYKTLITNVGHRVNDRLARDLDARSSGIIVNTCGWIDEEGFPTLMHAIGALGIDIVLVVGHDKLYSTFTTALADSGKNVTVVKLPRSGGVVTRVSLLFLYVCCFFCLCIVSLCDEQATLGP